MGERWLGLLLVASVWLAGCAPKVPPTASAAAAPIPAPRDVAAPRRATCTASGLCYRMLRDGAGTVHPGRDDKVEIRYTGWTTDGGMIDSTETRGKPSTFATKGLIPGLIEGLALMTEGGKARFWIPGQLAYAGRPGKPQGMLVFDVELLAVHVAPPPLPPPEDVAAPPADAARTASGLAWRVLTHGTGTEHPTAQSKVRVDYTGWTTDGHMFDSSVTRGKPNTFALPNVIPGWVEGVQLMVVGEKARFWMPANLAYGDSPARPSAPAGMLVFDIELLEIVP